MQLSPKGIGLFVILLAVVHGLANADRDRGGHQTERGHHNDGDGHGRDRGGVTTTITTTTTATAATTTGSPRVTTQGRSVSGVRGENPTNQPPDGHDGEPSGRRSPPGSGSAGQGRRGQIHESIRAERERLGRLSNRFIGKFATHGHHRQERNKTGKSHRHRNPKLIMWNGTAKLVRGATPDDTPEQIKLPENIHTMPRHGRRCLQGKEYRNLSSGAISAGPSAEGLTINDFKPCLERRRGHKQDASAAAVEAHHDQPQHDAPVPTQPFDGETPSSSSSSDASLRSEYSRQAERSRRKKRSESYTLLSLLWKDPSAGVPYAFDRTFPTQYRQFVKNAIGFWQNTTCLRFVEKASPTGIVEPFILFTRGPNGCSTDRLGPNPTRPYSTVIDIGTCENMTGSIAHEIGHAMGLAHSQKRVDRDESVKLYFQNIASSWASQFDRNPGQYFDDWGVPYYYDSIMHYFPYSATQNGLMTICPLDPLMELLMGQREEPAFGDISLMNRIYCQESCFPKTQLKGMQFYGNKSMTISGRTCQNWSTQSPVKHKFTTVGNHSSCRNPDSWDGGPWCYTTDPQVRFEPCFSPCEDLAATNRAKCQGWCYNGGYHNPKTCGCVCPKHASGVNCENVNKTAIYNKLTCGGKTELKVGQKMVINSPNYPSAYPINKACMWWFQSPNNTRVKVTVQDFKMEEADPNGCYDYVEIRPSICAAAIEPVDEMRFCGDSLAPSGSTQHVLYSDDNNMVVKFFSDETETAKGFKLTAEIASAISG